MRLQLLMLLLVCTGSVPAAGQGVPRVDTGWGLDLQASDWTQRAWHDARSEVYDAWRQYLLGNPHLQAPTELWSSAEREKWPAYDLTAALAYQGMPATVLDIRPAEGPRTEFIVQTLFASASGVERAVRPLAITRVWAIREQGKWVFANALPRLTSSWRQEIEGTFTYVVHPDLPFDSTRARRGIAFADSLAEHLGLPELGEITYVVAPSPEELHRVMGIDWAPRGGGFGYSIPWNKLLLSGSSTFGEDNRHELVHMVLAPVLEKRQTHGIVNEGLATWLGGSSDRSYSELLRAYSGYLDAFPSVELDDVLTGEGPDRGWYPAGAVLVELVHERGGWIAVRELLTIGRSNDELRAGLTRLLGITWPEIAAAWRTRIAAAGL